MLCIWNRDVWEQEVLLSCALMMMMMEAYISRWTTLPAFFSFFFFFSPPLPSLVLLSPPFFLLLLSPLLPPNLYQSISHFHLAHYFVYLLTCMYFLFIFIFCTTSCIKRKKCNTHTHAHTLNMEHFFADYNTIAAISIVRRAMFELQSAPPPKQIAFKTRAWLKHRCTLKASLSFSLSLSLRVCVRARARAHARVCVWITALSLSSSALTYFRSGNQMRVVNTLQATSSAMPPPKKYI